MVSRSGRAEAAGKKPRQARQEQSSAYIHTRLYDSKKSACLARRLGWMLTPAGCGARPGSATGPRGARNEEHWQSGLRVAKYGASRGLRFSSLDSEKSTALAGDRSILPAGWC